MLQTAIARYQEVRIHTASPGELLVSLYDGLFRFLGGARVCFEKNEKTRGRELISKSYAIISELYIALDHEAAPELCAHLAGIYDFCMGQLTIAARNADPKPLDDVLRVLRPLREAWTTVVRNPSRQSQKL
jgi:flagellar secretion chaperone FliS